MACDVALTAQIAGVTYDLNDGQELRLLDYDLGLAPVRRLSQRAPAQMGDTDLGYRIEPRFVDLFWAIRGRDVDDYRDIRGRFMEVFVARDDAVKLVFDFGDRARALDVHVDGELVWTERVEAVEKVSGVFKASDPRLYDPQIRTVLFSLEAAGESVSGWPIAWRIPWPIGTDRLNMAVGVLYGLGADGQPSRLAAPEFPVMRIFGPVTNPILTNETTGEVIALTANGGLTLADPDEWVEIDLASPPRRDAKTIRDQDGNSAEQYLSTDSDFATWHLAPAGERLPAGNWATGENVVRMSGTGVTGETLAVINYYDRYFGV